MRIQLPFNLNNEDKENLDEQTSNFILASSVALPVVTGTYFLTFLLSSNMQNVWYILNDLQLASFLLLINMRFSFHTKFLKFFYAEPSNIHPKHSCGKTKFNP